MKINVKCFAKVREILGRADIELDIPAFAIVEDALGNLGLEESNLKDIKVSAMFAVNHKYVQLSHPLQDGDELAIIPPVSGG